MRQRLAILLTPLESGVCRILTVYYWITLLVKFASFVFRLNIEDKIAWKSTSNGLFSETATLANNDLIRPNPRAKFVNSIWRLNLVPKVKLFYWKVIREILPTG